jgi:lipoprotein-anchoring transpeptidase ErfK/SrfK
MTNYPAFVIAIAALFITTPAFSQMSFSAQDINRAEFDNTLPDGLSGVTTKLQVLLDRAGANPGVIDGVAGENVSKAIQSYEEMLGLPPTGVMTPELWEKLRSNDPVIKSYTIEQSDVDRIVDAIPEDYAAKSKMQWLGYTSGAEAIAEKFHMDKDFVALLNPGQDFSTGKTVIVTDPGLQQDVIITRIVADKANKRVVIYGEGDKPVIVYPATIGSENTPSPEGTHEVRAIAEFPTYSYNPDINFKQGDNAEKLTIPPGPNGPVGSTWIDLTEPTYGIHGTPEPAQISKTASHGCIRLTNWDAAELAKLVKPGLKVTFVEALVSLY